MGAFSRSAGGSAGRASSATEHPREPVMAAAGHSARADARGDSGPGSQVGPRPPHHPPAHVPDLVLAALLLEHGVARLLARLAEVGRTSPARRTRPPGPVLPREVRSTDAGAVLPADLELEVRRRETPPVQDHAAARLTHALAALVGEGDRPRGTAGCPAIPRCPSGASGDPHAMSGRANSARVQCGDGNLERERSRQIQLSCGRHSSPVCRRSRPPRRRGSRRRDSAGSR